MKKPLTCLGITIIFLSVFYQFFFKKRYTDILHTRVDLEQFETNIDGIEKMISWYSKTYHIPAISAAIIENGKVKKYISTGTYSKRNNSPVNENSIYRIASTGKLIISIIAHQLENEGLIDFDKNINFYLSDLIEEQAKKKLEPIKIKNLLLHNSGLGRDWKAFTESDIIDKLNHNPLDYKTGEKWSYSNFGYATLTLIIEKASGLTYEQLLKKYITDKFNIDKISTHLKKNQEHNYVTPYFPELKILKGEDIEFGKQSLTSGIYTNVKSLSQLLIQQINHYKQPDSIKLNSPFILNRKKINSWNENSYYGYGIFEHHFELEDLKSIKQVQLEHGGDADGFACIYGFFPKYSLGVVILTSSGGKWFSDMGRNINSLLIKEHYKRKESQLN